VTVLDDVEIKFYFAYTSPFTWLAWASALELERSHRVALRFIHYVVNIRRVYGNLDNADTDRRKVRYLYLDARRIAKERGLVIYPPKRIFSSRLASTASLFGVKTGWTGLLRNSTRCVCAAEVASRSCTVLRAHVLANPRA